MFLAIKNNGDSFENTVVFRRKSRKHRNPTEIEIFTCIDKPNATVERKPRHVFKKRIVKRFNNQPLSGRSDRGDNFILGNNPFDQCKPKKHRHRGKYKYDMNSQNQTRKLITERSIEQSEKRNQVEEYLNDTNCRINQLISSNHLKFRRTIDKPLFNNYDTKYKNKNNHKTMCIHKVTKNYTKSKYNYVAVIWLNIILFI